MLKTSTVLASLLLILSTAVVACGSSGLVTSVTDTATVTIGPNGGTLALSDSAVLVVFPPGALATSVEFTATPRSDPGPTVLLGTVYDIQPSTTFLLPVLVTVKYIEAALPSGVRESELGLYLLDTSGWTKIPNSTVDEVANTVSASVTSFSTYGVLGAPVVNVSISGPSSVDEGSQINLSATATDIDQNVLPDRDVTWQSLTPQQATVTQNGVVMGQSDGTALITASSEGQGDTVQVTVNDTGQMSGTVHVAHDFNDGGIGQFTNPWGSSVDHPDDPTLSGRGKVLRVTYSPVSGQSQERGLMHTMSPRMTFDDELWFKGDVYIPDQSGTNPAWRTNHNRKLIDFQGGGCRVILNRQSGNILNFAGEAQEDGIWENSTGVTISDDTWYTIEVRLVANSAGPVSNGIFELYVNNSSSTPDYTETDMDCWNGNDYLEFFLIGFQLTINNGDPQYSEVRYWDNLRLGTTRN